VVPPLYRFGGLLGKLLPEGALTNFASRSGLAIGGLPAQRDVAGTNVPGTKSVLAHLIVKRRRRFRCGLR